MHVCVPCFGVGYCPWSFRGGSLGPRERMGVHIVGAILLRACAGAYLAPGASPTARRIQACVAPLLTWDLPCIWPSGGHRRLSAELSPGLRGIPTERSAGYISTPGDPCSCAWRQGGG
eukprot:812431-Pyramimonas_sp.AAC.1